MTRRPFILKPSWRSTSPPSSERCARAAWTAGCSTTSTAPTRSRRAVAGLADAGHLATRRWYYLIPAEGQPQGAGPPHRAAQPRSPARREAGLCGPRRARSRPDGAAGRRDSAWRWSTRPTCAIPYVSRVDAGTVEAVRARGVEMVSSGDLVQQFEAAWTPAQLASHRAASEALYRIKDRAFEAAGAGGPRRPATGRVRPPAADVALVRRGRAGQRFAAGRGGRAQRGEPALPAHQAIASRPSQPMRCCCWTCGANAGSQARLCRHHLGGLHRREQVPERMRAGVRRRGRGRATRP